MTTNLLKIVGGWSLILFGLSFAVAQETEPNENASVDPTGTWVWEQQFGNRSQKRELELRLDGEKLTGTLKTIGGFRGPTPPSEIVNGKVVKDKISFDVIRKFRDSEFTTTYSAVIAGDELAGLSIFNFGGRDRESEWLAKRTTKEVSEAGSEANESLAEAASQAATKTADIRGLQGPSSDVMASIKPERIPTPGPATAEPYVPQPILPGGIVVPLYAKGSTALNNERVHEAEKYNMTKGVPGRIQSIVNIHNPSIEVHRVSPSINTRTAVILAAGGGHRTLNVGTEAGDFVPFFFNYGVNTIILRNRLRSDGYSSEDDAVTDALQAIRLVRANAKDWGIDPHRIGIIGFSAGAELSGPAAVRFEAFDKEHKVEEGLLSDVSSRPDFVGLLYPGPTPFTRDADTVIPQNAPPSFVATPGSGDRVHAIWAMDYFNAMLRNGVPNIELHVYGNGVHAGGLKDRNGTPFGTWQDRYIDWFRDLGFLSQPGEKTKAATDVETFVNKRTR